MRKYNDDKYETASILGSFNKHYELICRTAEYFQKNGIRVLAPDITSIKENNDGYAILESDQSDDATVLEAKFLENCLKSDFVYVCDLDGYIGKTVMLELGFMLGKGQEVFFMETPAQERLIKEMTQKKPIVYTPKDLVRMIKRLNEFSWVDFAGNDLFDRLDKPVPDFRLPEDKGER